ncbi:hypothetical protein QBC43DRAFT_326445 [Cladorrhinum sp. PSN259]|nr:hypothetical protein QBC43DRAFT_326445 [Cladorrhinum sp. PSN259]
MRDISLSLFQVQIRYLSFSVIILLLLVLTKMATSNNGAPAGATSMIIPSTAYLQRLHSLVPSTEAREQEGYIRKLTDEQLKQKKRCIRCGVRPFHNVRGWKPRNSDGKSHQAAAPPPKTSLADDALTSMNGSSGVATEESKQLRCKFHLGKVEYKVWTCCRKHVTEAACGGADDHLLAEDPGDRALKKRWQFFETPAGTQPEHRLAVAIDCEMGTASNKESELIRLTVVDYFTGKTLIDTLVYPSVHIENFNTRWSGVTRAQMENARKQRQCIFGTAAARNAIFNYVGRDTFVVGHGMQSDLLCLRWHHDRIVDSLLIESGIRKAEKMKAEEEKMRAEAEREKSGIEATSPLPEEGQPKNEPSKKKRNPDGMSLQALVLKKLGRSIQLGKKGHDSLEDAVAARDLIHSYIKTLSAPSAS